MPHEVGHIGNPFTTQPYNYLDALSPYDTSLTAPLNIGASSNIPDPTRDMEFLLSPLEQYRRTQAQRIGPDYFGMSPSVQRAAERRFNPLYGLFQAAEPSGRYASFADFLREQPAVTAADINEATRRAGAYTQLDDPIQYALYYGGENVSTQAAVDRQQRLAQTQMLSSMGPRAAFNPTLARAASGAVGRMYQNYLSGAGSDAFSSTGPTGFMNYYLQQRNV